VAWVCERIIPTERPPLVVVPTFADRECYVVSAADPLRPHSRISRPAIEIDCYIIYILLEGYKIKLLPRKNSYLLQVLSAYFTSQTTWRICIKFGIVSLKLNLSLNCISYLTKSYAQTIFIWVKNVLLRNVTLNRFTQIFLGFGRIYYLHLQG
jgi:hypothetical protein